MLFLGSLLIDSALLAVLLLVVAKIDFLTDFMKPLSIVLLTTTVSIVAALLLRGVLWGVPQIIIVVGTLHFLVGWFFELQQRERRIIVGVFFGVKFALAVAAQLL